MVDALSDDQVNERMRRLNGWNRDGQTITKTFALKDFPHAVGFVVEIGMIAETVWHHPDLTTNGNKVGVTLTSHDVGRLTTRDFDLADKIEESIRDR